MPKTYPVYLIAGFLDSGKTTFINGILSDGFAIEDRTLLLRCEEGETEYDKKYLRNVTIFSADDPEELTPQLLEAERKKCRAEQILVEYNGMWDLQDFYVRCMPQTWVLYQIIATVEGPSFLVYSKNMAAQMMDKLRNADMIVINRCDQALCDELRRKNLRLINRRADIFLEREDGQGENYMDGTVSAFDLDQDVIEIAGEDYGLWYVEIMDSPRMYEGKTLVFRAMMCKPPKYGRYFTPGRFAMVCCADDMSFLAVACIGYDVKDIPERTWVEVRAVCRVEHWDPYEGDGPVLHVESVTPCEKPKDEIVQM